MWVYMYMERSDGARADADGYTRTQTEQSGNETTRTASSGNSESDRSCTEHMNEQHRYGCKLLLATAKARFGGEGTPASHGPPYPPLERECEQSLMFGSYPIQVHKWLQFIRVHP